MSFVPKPPKISIAEIITNKNKLTRNLKIKGYRSINIQNSTIEKSKGEIKLGKPFTEKSTWEPPDTVVPPMIRQTIKNINQATNRIINHELAASNNRRGKELNELENNALIHDFFRYTKNRDENNLTTQEKAAMRELKKNREIVIKPADKGGATVILDRDAYVAEALRQLQNTTYYAEIPTTVAPENKAYITNVLNALLDKHYITQSQHKYLSGPENYSLRKFYLLPKIHKPRDKWPQQNMPEGRPIVSDTNSESSRIASYIDSFINPLSTKGPAYLKNSYDFVRKVRNQTFPGGYLFVTGDVKSLYTNMHIDRIIDTIKNTFKNNPDTKRPDTEIIDLLDYTLRHNDFSFNNKQYLQKLGAPMGKIYAPSLANIYLQNFDEAAKNDFEIKPELYFRFLDDIHFIWGGGTTKLREYENFLNTLIPGIEIKLEYDYTTIPFLDVLLYAHNNTIQTKTYFKPTDTHQLLQPTSYHPKHTFTGILKSQFIRFARLSSTYEDYQDTCNILFTYLQPRGYTFTEFRKLRQEVWRSPETSPLQKPATDKNNAEIVPIIMNYSTLGTTINRAYKTIMNNDYNMNSYRKISAYTAAPNLRQILVRSTLPNMEKVNIPQNTNRGRYTPCHRPNCYMCRYHSPEAVANVTSHSTRTTHSVIGEMSCNTTNVVYLITCTQCKIQYVGETGRKIRDRLTDHWSTITTNKTTCIATHFRQGHKRTDLHIVPIETIQDTTNATTIRKTQERQWTDRLQTRYPSGLNGLPIHTEM